MAKLTKEQKQLFDELHRSRKEDIKVLNKKQFRGIWNSVIEKYPESAHFVYELLQNADDAEATEVYFIVNKHEMIFKHNGAKHFDVTPEDDVRVGDINSITGIGDSSKSDNENKIGKFGVGFKAVFQYTNTPEIYDDYFKFKIENYIVPTLLPHDHPDRKEGETLFLFPFKNGEESYSDIVQRLERLQNPILFLRNLKNIKWRIDSEEGRKGKVHTYSKKLIERQDFEDDSWLEIYRIKDGSEITSIFLFSENIMVNSEKKEFPISVGYYYDEEQGKLITDRTQNIFCYFPTRETFKTCFISHAPFLLTDNRQNLKPNNEYNRSLIEFLAELAAKAILRLRDYGKQKRHLLIDENLTSIIPQYKKNYFHSLDELFEEPIHNAFTGIINSEAIFLSRNGKYLKKSDSYIGTPRELVSLLSKKQLRTLLKPYNVDFDDFDIDFLKSELAQSIKKREDRFFEGIKEFHSIQLGYRIDEDFINEQEFKWVIKLYNFLRLYAVNLWKLSDPNKTSDLSKLIFRKAPIIKTHKGEWVEPFIDFVTPNVYLPIKKEESSGYNFVSKEFIENESAKKFFDELGLKEPNTLDYIKSIILTKFRGDYFKLDNEEIKSDFEVVVSYYFGLQDRAEKEQLINLLREKIYLVGSNDSLERPDDLYYCNHLLLKYFRGDGSFFDVEFYKTTFDKRNIADVKGFMYQLGVKRYPSIEPHKRYSPSKIAWFSDLVPLFESCSEFEIHDNELDGFEKAVSENRIDKELSLYIWNEVLPSINFKEHEYIDFVYRKWRGRYHYTQKHESSFKHQLINYKWIYTCDGELVSPSSIYLEDLAPEYNRNNGLIAFLGITLRPKEKSIKELGGTEKQQLQQEMGVIAEKYGVSSPDELEAKLKRLEVLEKQSEKELLKKKTPRTPPTSVTDDLRNHHSEGKHESSNLNDLFSDHNLEANSNDNHDEGTEEKPSSYQNRIDDIINRHEEEQRNEIKREEIRQQVSELDKYSKEWFQKNLDLEYWESRGNVSDEQIKRSISITFNSVKKDPENNRLYELRNPSRDIPSWVEEIEGLTVKFLFDDRDELPCSFEVASVRDFSIRLKAKAGDANSLASIDWRRLTQARIDINNPTNLVDNFRRAFLALPLPDGFNLKDNLSSNLSFVFGPPGTGKTTYLANYIINYIDSNKNDTRILVLAPTNKACDVLVKKIIESTDSYSWLGRFVTTGDPEIEDAYVVCDRDSELYKEDKCCIVTTMARLPYDGFQNGDGNHFLRDIDWDFIICDEASMLPVSQITYAIYKFKGTPFLIAGDPMQIAPIDINNVWGSENIYDMIQLNSFENPKTEPIQFNITNLDTQYRAVPAIGGLFSDFAYGGRLKHHMKQCDQIQLNMPEIALKSVTYIPFRVENYDSMFGIKTLSKSPIHIYSALLATELSKYIAKKHATSSIEDKVLDVGIICPYSSQAQLIEKMLEQETDLPNRVKITTGTIHSFQGDQCNIVIAVFNPPKGLRRGATNAHLNNLNIINVAISRAKDYLIVLMPDKESCEGYENLIQINRLGAISTKYYRDSTTVIKASEIERVIFGTPHYLESNTFVTSHQLANVYTKPTCLYEIRVDENSVDIQIGQ